MPDFDPAQFVIGTSAWGSRIPVSRAVSVGAALVGAGFTRFDSAPTYGSSYAHYALNRLAEETGVEITVDTKHGQLNERSLRGIAKKILRAPSLGELASSFWQQPSRDRMSDKFWATDRLMQVYLMSRRELNHAKIGVFYYHAPPMPVLGPEIPAFQDILASHGVTLGIAEPMMEDLVWLRRHPERRMIVQVRFVEFMRHYELIRELENVDVWVNGVYRDQAEIREGLGINSARFHRIIADYFVGHVTRKLIIGINSHVSVCRLQALVSGPATSILLSEPAGG